MALTKILEGGIADDAVGNTKLDLSENYAFTGTVTGAGGVNTPYFYGEKASNQTITRNTTTQVTGFTSNELDSDSAFDGDTFTVPSGKGGLYYFHASIESNYSGVGADGERNMIKFFVDGSASSKGHEFWKNSGYNIYAMSNAFSFIKNLNASQTVDVRVYNKDGNASGNALVSTGSHFFGFKIIV
tara:strand:+ start:43 stop:600 length:558 start_codon:yes stop_codon:yes gene_type:complete